MTIGDGWWMLTNSGEIHGCSPIQGRSTYLYILIYIYTTDKLFYFIRHIRGCMNKRVAAEVYCNFQNPNFCYRCCQWWWGYNVVLILLRQKIDKTPAEVYCNLQNLIFSYRSLSFFIVYTCLHVKYILIHGHANSLQKSMK